MNSLKSSAFCFEFEERQMINKYALVTGASGGIGKEKALKLNLQS